MKALKKTLLRMSFYMKRLGMDFSKSLKKTKQNPKPQTIKISLLPVDLSCKALGACYF